MLPAQLILSCPFLSVNVFEIYKAIFTVIPNFIYIIVSVPPVMVIRIRIVRVKFNYLIICFYGVCKVEKETF